MENEEAYFGSAIWVMWSERKIFSAG